MFTKDGLLAAVALALARSVPEVVVKLGAGRRGLGPGDEVRPVPAVTTGVVDTTGAGDGFAAGLLAARLAGADIDAALHAAVRLGAVAVGRVGGPPTGVAPGVAGPS